MKVHTMTLTLLFEDSGFELRSLCLHSVSLTFLTVLMEHLTGSSVRKKGFTLTYTVPEDTSVMKGPPRMQEQELVTLHRWETDDRTRMPQGYTSQGLLPTAYFLQA